MIIIIVQKINLTIMPFLTESNDYSLQFQAYTPGLLHVNQNTYKSPLLLNQNGIVQYNAPTVQTLSHTLINDWVCAYQPQLILIATGPKTELLPNTLFVDCHHYGIGTACLSTPDCLKTLVILQNDFRAYLCLLTP